CFFFQAEDGIRDPLVTGVQTCALPISPRSGRPRGGTAARANIIGCGAAKRYARLTASSTQRCPWVHTRAAGRAARTRPIRALGRSEERRVGRGGRWRRAAEQEKRRDRV